MATKKTKTNGTSKVNGTQAVVKLQALRSQLPKAIMERSEVADGLLVALLSGAHILLLGEPGTAKSLLIRLVCKAILGASWFQWLLTKFSTPEELFGPYDLQGLKAGTYARVVTGKLPEAHVAFLDEIFKANAAILNSLLTLMEERLFHNGTSATATPLLTMVGASNELPEDESLAALHDRFLLRYWIGYLRSDSNFMDLLDPGFEAGPQVTATLTLEELSWLQAQVRTVSVSRDILETIATIRRDLARDGIVASDRRWKASVRGLQAHAYLNGRTAVATTDLRLLNHILWTTREEMNTIRSTVGQAADPILADVLELVDDAVETFRDLADQAPTDTTEMESRFRFAATITSSAGSLKATTDAIYTALARSGMTLDTASQEVQDGMARATAIQEELGRMSMAYATGQDYKAPAEVA